MTRIPKDATAWNSGTLSEAGATFEHTFEVKGTYDYFCIPHESIGMMGSMTVRLDHRPRTYYSLSEPV